MVSEQEVRKLAIKKARRDLLAVLKMVYPAQFGFADLCLSLPTIEKPMVRVDLHYLVDKRYVEWTNKRPNASLEDGDFRLTATGVETADRINEDPAPYA